jgi:polynucleotide 5'-hydroxyl-kinase GRC3/NOL9
VVDTTGLISGGLGKALKTAKIRALGPAHIIAIQREDELEHILPLVGDARIHRLKASCAAKKRSASSRRAYRKNRLEEYFGKQEQFEHILDASAIQFFYRGRLFRHRDREMPQKAIIGLNRNDDTVALGIIEAVAETTVYFRSPLRSLKGINRVVCGDMTMS